MLRYDSFILEKKIYDLLLESKVEFSKGFVNILSSISNPISKAILSLNTQEKDVVQNYIDSDLNSTDMVTFIQDRRAKQITNGYENIFKISDGRKHLKSDGFSSDTGREQNTKIYKLLGLDIRNAKKASNGDEVKILSEIASPFDSSKIYCSYQSTKDESVKCVINKEGLSQSTDVFKRLWTDSRNSMRIGRLVRALLPLTGLTFTDSEVEKFVNEYKSTIDILNDAFSKLDVVKGDKISYWYNIENYSNREGTLGSSCMADVDASYFDIYVGNPDVCQLVILYDDNGSIVDGRYKSKKIAARALLWTTTEGDKFMDRIYTSKNSDEQLFKKFAEKNGWWCKYRQSSDPNFSAELGTSSKKPKYIVQLKKWGEEYPYLDTLMYLNTNDGRLSNDGDLINANALLNSTGGGYDDIDSDDYDDDDDY